MDILRPYGIAWTYPPPLLLLISILVFWNLIFNSFCEINFLNFRYFEIFMQIARKFFSFLSRNHLEFWRKRDSTLTNEFHQWYISTPKPCNGVDFSEATMRALFFATQPGGSPLCVAFFCAENGGLTPLNFSKQNLKLEFMGSDPLTKFLRWCPAAAGSDPIGHSASLFRGHDGVRPPVVPGSQDVQLL